MPSDFRLHHFSVSDRLLPDLQTASLGSTRVRKSVQYNIAVRGFSLKSGTQLDLQLFKAIKRLTFAVLMARY